MYSNKVRWRGLARLCLSLLIGLLVAFVVGVLVALLPGEAYGFVLSVLGYGAGASFIYTRRYYKRMINEKPEEISEADARHLSQIEHAESPFYLVASILLFFFGTASFISQIIILVK